MPSTFSMPTRIISGYGCISEVGEYLQKNDNNPRVLLCTDSGLSGTSIIRKITAVLAEKHISYVIFDGVVPNPRIGTVEKGLQLLRENQSNVIVGVGGGSSMDTAKAIAALDTSGGSIKDYEGRDKLKNTTKSLIAIPTTYGTGSEANCATLITDENRQEKMIIVSQYLQPKCAFIDPDLMVELPPLIGASTVVDALTHAIESYTSMIAQPITDALNLEAIRLIKENALAAVMTNNNVEATCNVAIASTMAGMAFGNTGLGLVHAIAHALGGITDIAHGVANAVLLPHVMKFNIPVVSHKYKKVGLAMGLNLHNMESTSAAEMVFMEVERFCNLLEIPRRLRDVGIQREIFKRVAENAMKDPNFARNPRQADQSIVLKILNDAY